MRNYLFVILCFLSFCSSAQTKTDTISVTISIYPFAYNSKFKNGSIALGSSVLIRNDKFSFQLGVLLDAKNYGYHYNSSSGAALSGNYYEPERKVNIFVPLLFNYHFYDSQETSYILTGGFIIGGKWYYDDDDSVQEEGEVSYIFGTGLSSVLSKNLNVRTIPNIRLNSKNVFPGLLLDLAYSFNKSKI